jgi:hypothetical protein
MHAYEYERCQKIYKLGYLCLLKVGVKKSDKLQVKWDMIISTKKAINALFLEIQLSIY